MTLKPPFLIWQAQRVQAFLLQPTRFCKLSASFSSPIKTATSPSFSSSQTLALFLQRFPLLCHFCYLTVSRIFGRNYLFLPPSLLSCYTESTVTHLFGAVIRLMSWQGKVHCSNLLLSHAVPLLLPFVFSLLFPRTGGVQSHLNFFDTQVPSVSTEKLVVPRHAR